MYARPSRPGLGVEARVASGLGTGGALGFLAYDGEGTHGGVLRGDLMAKPLQVAGQARPRAAVREIDTEAGRRDLRPTFA